MEYSPPFNFYAPLWESQLSEIDAQHDDGTGNHPVASDLQLAIVINPATPVCCGKACGTYVPLVVNGIYHDPNGGINHITFNLSTSPSCGIPVARVFGGNLEGLIGRDDIVVLNPKSNSIRLRIELPGYEVFQPKITTPNGGLKIQDLVHKVCAQLKKFTVKDNTRIGDQGWVVGEGGIVAEQLVLVSLRRISVGSWVPCVRLSYGPNGN